MGLQLREFLALEVGLSASLRRPVGAKEVSNFAGEMSSNNALALAEQKARREAKKVTTAKVIQTPTVEGSRQRPLEKKQRT
ncbi:putative MutS protein like protein [Sesbania bispinosa]|nr:putative MutS protein like protein [Sesbania bispinosa]